MKERTRPGWDLATSHGWMATRGFVFGSFAAEGPSLLEHLGGAAETIDRLVRTSPEGEVEVTAGFLKHRVKANWKFILENECDGYHPAFVHSSIFGVADSAIGTLYGGKSTAVTRDYGNGHTEIDLRPEFSQTQPAIDLVGADEARLPDYTSRMKAALFYVPGSVAYCCYTGNMSDPAERLYDLDYYLRLAEGIVEAGAHVLAIEDVASLLRAPAAHPGERAAQPLRPAVHVAAQHAWGPIGQLVAAWQAGASAVDGAAAPMAGTTSQPALTSIVAAAAHTATTPGCRWRRFDD